MAGCKLYRINCHDNLFITGKILVVGPLMGEISLENGLEALSHMGIEVLWEKTCRMKKQSQQESALLGNELEAERE